MSMSKASSSSGSSCGEVTVLWDFENVWIPEGYDIKILKANIEAALKTHDQNFVIKELIAIGPDSGSKYQVLKICEDIKFTAIPRTNIRCDSQCGGFAVTNQQQCQDVVMRKTDVADKFMIKEMFLQILGKNENILVITGNRGDCDFIASIRGLNKRRKYVMLAVLDHSSGELIRSAKVTWLWKSESEAESTMLKGGKSMKIDR